MISYPPAKVNIGLNIVEKRPDGYHNIQSVFYAIPLFDILEINESTAFTFSTSGLEITGNYRENIVFKAFELLRKKHKINAVNIHLHKQIPMGAGLGGGSADGAYALSMLNQIFKLELSTRQLEEYALSLGSDCPFFIESKPKYVTGIGNNMAPLTLDLTGKYLKIINPEIHISTKAAYSGILPKANSLYLPEVLEDSILSWRNTVENDFERTVFAKYPKIKSIKELMYREGAIYAAMSGSGSTVYGIYSSLPKSTQNFSFEKILSL